MSKWEKTGQPPRLNPANPVYGDFTNACEFQEALEKIHTAEAAFESLPATVRRRVGNDPARFIEFCRDPANHDEMVKLGLAEAPPKDPPGASPETKGGENTTPEGGVSVGPVVVK